MGKIKEKGILSMKSFTFDNWQLSNSLGIKRVIQNKVPISNKLSNITLFKLDYLSHRVSLELMLMKTPTKRSWLSLGADCRVLDTQHNF